MKMGFNKGIFEGSIYYQDLEEIEHILKSTIKIVNFSEAESLDTIHESPGYDEINERKGLKTESEGR